jgi:hypothetical protein
VFLCYISVLVLFSGVGNGCSAELGRRTLSEFSKRDLEN